MTKLQFLFTKIILSNKITNGSKTNPGSDLENVSASTLKSSSFCIIGMTKSKADLSSIGEISTWKMHNSEESVTPMMWSQKDGNMQSEGMPYLINSRGVPIIYFKAIISVIFNRNFEILNVKSTY